MVQISTGPDNFIFDAYYTLLIRNSDWFTMNCPSTKELTGPVNFSHIHQDVFTLWLTWLTTGNIESAGECLVIAPGLKTELLQGQMHRKRIQLIECYVLAEFLVDRRYMNYIMDQIISFSKQFHAACGPPQGLGEGGRLIFKKTREGSLLRKLELDIFLSTVSLESMSPRSDVDSHGNKCKITEHFYWQFAMLATRVAREGKKVPPPPWQGNKCAYYHDHSDVEKKYACEEGLVSLL